jgi:hypothetical protein
MAWGSSPRKSRQPFRILCESVFTKSAPWSSTEPEQASLSGPSRSVPAVRGCEQLFGNRHSQPARGAQFKSSRGKHGKDPAEALDEALAAFFEYMRKCVRILQSQPEDMKVAGYRFHSLQGKPRVRPHHWKLPHHVPLVGRNAIDVDVED